MGGLSSVISSFTGSGGARAAGQAGQIQSDALLGSIPAIQESISSAQAGLQPFQNAGTQALTQQQALLGLSGTEAQDAARATETAGQKFLRERGERAIVRNASATGGLGGGNVKTALQEQGIGLAAQNENTQFNRLAGLSGRGQQAAGDVGNLAVGGAQAIGGIQSQAAQAQAGGILGAEQARASGVNNLINTGVGVGTALLSDKRMKKNVKDLDLKECYDLVMKLPLKTWQYLDMVGEGDNTHFGPMAQDAPDIIKMSGEEKLDLHDELMLISGALQYAHNQRLN